MPITFEHSGSPGIIGAASAAAGYGAGQERRAKNAAEFAQQQQRLELAARAQQQQAYQFEAGRFDRQNALVRDEQLFLLRNEFQAERDQRLFDQSLQQDRLRNAFQVERDRIADQAQLGYLDRQYQLLGERDDALFVRGLAEEAADRVNALEKELAQTPFDADGENIRRKLQESLNRIRKDTTLRPGAYLEAVSQWEDDVRRSGIQNHVQPPPDPKQLFGQWTKNEETGDFDFQPGEYPVTPWGTYVLPDGTQKSVEKSFWESLTPQAKGKMTGAPPEMFIDTRSEGASMRPIAPFTTAEGFDADAYQKAADAIRKELTTEVYDKDNNPTSVKPKEADVQKEVDKRWYAVHSKHGGPKLFLQGLARGELTVDDVKEMGFGDQVTDAVKQSVLSGELNPAQARQLGFDVSVTDHGIGVRMRSDSQTPSAAAQPSGQKQIGQQSSTQPMQPAGERIMENRKQAAPVAEALRQTALTLDQDPGVQAALKMFPGQAAPVVQELQLLMGEYADTLSQTGVGMEFTNPEKFERMRELRQILKNMSNPESLKRLAKQASDRAPDTGYSGP